jgi:hypothetical protein
MNNTEPDRMPTPSVATLSTLTLLAGVGGMAVSFLFLASSHQLDVLAGAAGFVAGAILVSGGLLSSSVQTRSPRAGEIAARVFRCLFGMAPCVVAILAWPVFYLFLWSGMLAMPAILIACSVWAWWGSASVAENACALFGWSQVRTIHHVVFFVQLIAIAASLPLLRMMLDTLESMGYKVGWS